jgi:hypothetical protein
MKSETGIQIFGKINEHRILWKSGRQFSRVSSLTLHFWKAVHKDASLSIDHLINNATEWRSGATNPVLDDLYPLKHIQTVASYYICYIITIQIHF